MRRIRQLTLLTLMLLLASVTVKAAMPADTPVSINYKSESVVNVLKDVQRQSGLTSPSMSAAPTLFSRSLM